MIFVGGVEVGIGMSGILAENTYQVGKVLPLSLTGDHRYLILCNLPYVTYLVSILDIRDPRYEGSVQPSPRCPHCAWEKEHKHFAMLLRAISRESAGYATHLLHCQYHDIQTA